MALSKDHKAATRQRIVRHASTRFRQDGLNAVGLRALLGDAGVTHGAFYAHFPARTDLVAEAVAQALADTRAALSQAADGAVQGERLDAVIDSYLSDLHVQAAARGCAGAALAPEIAREGAPVRAAFERGLDAIVALLADLLPPGGSAQQREDRARALFSLMMGCLQLARTTPSADAAARLLAAGRASARLLSRTDWEGAGG